MISVFVCELLRTGFNSGSEGDVWFVAARPRASTVLSTASSTECPHAKYFRTGESSNLGMRGLRCGWDPKNLDGKISN